MQSLRKQGAALLSKGLDLVLPPRCVVSGEIVEKQGMIAPSAWSKLDFIQAPFCDSCGFPFDFAVDAGSLCTACLDHPPPFDVARMALKYNDASRSLILGFKHGDQTHNVKAFTPWLLKAGVALMADADLLAPVPLHHWRMVARRYNQAALMAANVAKAAGKPCAPDLLRRVRATPSQGHLKAGERYKNVRGAFAVSPKYSQGIKGKTILLVDDVYTTGATLKECTKVLLNAGASKIYVLALARVVKDGFF